MTVAAPALEKVSCLVSSEPGFLTAPPNNSKPATTCHPLAFCQVFKVAVLSLRTGVRAQKREPMRVEKDANEETQKASPIAEGGEAGGRSRPQPLGAQLPRKEELRAAGNSRARWPSYKTADVAKPTTIVRQELFFLGLAKALGRSPQAT